MLLNSIKNIIKKNTGLLLRMDDISENMNWEFMDKCEMLFDNYNLKPLLGVIPANKDPELLKFPKNSKFWDRINNWKKKGWEITMHGNNHLYTKTSDKKDIFNYGGKSEFYGLDYSEQLDKIKNGLNEFKKRDISIRSFFAPNHIYDINTLKALKACGIKIIIDGYGLFPFYKHDLLFIPQLFYKEIFLPFGIQSTQIHLNYWADEDFKNFEKFIVKNHKKVISFDQALERINNGVIFSVLNFLIKIILKTLRFRKKL